MLSVALLLALSQELVKTDTVVGKGLPCDKDDIVTVLYKGTLTSGKIFDESKGKAPFAFKIGAKQVIVGWDEGVAGMKVGGKRTLVVPPSLAYGDRDLGEIPPNSTLKFEIELLRIDAKDSKPVVVEKQLKAGKGNPVVEGDKVTLHYKGSFLNGKVFGSSWDERKPVEFLIAKGKVIPGFLNSVIGMKEGEMKAFTVPQELGYGMNGRPPVIGRYATLLFEVEVLKISKP